MFLTYQQIPTIGAEQIRHLTVSRAKTDCFGTSNLSDVASASTLGVSKSNSLGGEARWQHADACVEVLELLAVAQCVDDASGWNTTSAILEYVA